MRSLVEAVEAGGLDPSSLVAGSVTLDRLRGGTEPLDWVEIVAVLHRLESAADAATIDRIGREVVRTPTLRRARFVGDEPLSPRELFWAFTRLVCPAALPGVRTSFDERGEGRLRIAIELPPGVRGSRTLFLLLAGTIAALPRLLALPDAIVDATIQEERAAFVVAPEARPPIGERAARTGDARAAAQQSPAEIERYRHELETSYAALVRSRQDFRALLEKMSDSVCVHREGRVVWGNRAFLGQLGRERIDDVIGLRILEDIVHPDDRAELARTMRLPELPAGMEARRFRVLRPDGSTIVIEISEPQIVEFDGMPARLVVGRDITEQRREQSALVVADRMASIGVLAAGVAHEVNNPLAYVLANLTLAEREIPHGPPALAGAIGAAREGIERVRAIVRDLNTLARGDEEHVERVDLSAVVESAVSLAKRSIEPRARLSLALSEVAVRGNRARLGQVVLNLLLNAADAIDEGAPEGNVIAVSTACTGGGEAVLTVRDSGAGIEPAALRRIFDPFFTTKDPGRGTGLGLSICHRIVTGLGGRIEVDSAPGKGTTFRVLLRVDPAGASSAPPSPMPKRARQTPRMAASRPKVLVVDDEPRLLSAISMLLSDHYEVVALSDGKAALETLRADDSFDAVLCDLLMAGMTGMALHDALRVERPGLERRMVFMTGGAFSSSARAFLSSTHQPWVEKPFEMDRLVQILGRRIARGARNDG